MSIHAITSPHNQRVKDAVKLRTARQRSKQGRTLIDGSREIGRAIDAGVQMVELFVCEPLCMSADSLRVIERLRTLDARVWHVTPEVFERLAFGERHEGIVAVIEPPSRTLDQLQVPAGSLIAVLCGLEKPGNVGAIVRSADGAGVGGVIVVDPVTDLFNPNCVRASLGTIFSQPIATATTEETLNWLRARGDRMFAARLDAEQVHTEVDLRSGAAIVLGSEAAGLPPAWHATDVTSIKLPMHGTADSLNVSAAAAVLFYEALRQRETLARNAGEGGLREQAG